MKVRILSVVAVLVGGLLLATSPAQASPAVPVLSDPDTSTPGHLTATVSSPGAPKIQVYLRRSADEPTGYLVGTAVLDGLSGIVDVPTWGGAAESYVSVSACALSHCSRETEPVLVHPTDVAPQATWSDDRTLAPGAFPTVTINDPTGGGTLAAGWKFDDGGQYDLAPVSRNGTTTLFMGFGSGSFTLYRCGGAPGTFCTPIAGTTEHYTRIGGVSVTSPLIPLLTQAQPRAKVALQATTYGQVPWPAGSTFDLTWSVRKPSGTPVASGGASGTLTPGQTALPAVPVDATNFAEGAMRLDAEVVVHTVDYGDLHATLMSAHGDDFVTFYTDTQGPVVTAMKLDRTTIYPRMASARYPGRATLTVTGKDLIKVMVCYGSKDIAGLDFPSYSTEINVTWSGKKGTGGLAAPGRYRMYAVDQHGNRSKMYREIVVSGRTR